MIRWLARLVALALLAYMLGFAVFAVMLARPAGDQRTDAIVVLTGGSGRLERGFDLLERGQAPLMLISGVDRTVRAADLERLYRVRPALMDCCVTLGREAFDTRSNADEVARWVERHHVRSIRLVTNDLHMTRARHELAKRVGTSLSTLPDAVPTDPDLGQIFSEYNKYLLGRAADLVGI
jgi:uncharacterized SAM-binding protein YcdF (DUF218 family)